MQETVEYHQMRRIMSGLCPHLTLFIDLVQQICYKISWNCGLNDKSMKFGTLLEYHIRKIFGYMDIAEEQSGGHFSKLLLYAGSMFTHLIN